MKTATILLDDTEDGLLHVGVDFDGEYDGTSGAHRAAARLLKVLESELPKIGDAEIIQAGKHSPEDPPKKFKLDPMHQATRTVVPVTQQLVLAKH